MKKLGEHLGVLRLDFQDSKNHQSDKHKTQIGWLPIDSSKNKRQIGKVKWSHFKLSINYQCLMNRAYVKLYVKVVPIFKILMGNKSYWENHVNTSFHAVWHHSKVLLLLTLLSCIINTQVWNWPTIFHSHAKWIISSNLPVTRNMWCFINTSHISVLDSARRVCSQVGFKYSTVCINSYIVHMTEVWGKRAGEARLNYADDMTNRFGVET